MSKNGSDGSKARTTGLPPERRKEIAREAAKARWKKKEVPAEVQPVTLQPVAATPPEPPAPEPTAPAPPSPAEIGKRRAAKEKAIPKVYGQALTAAEKEYADLIEELSYHDEKASRIKARLPGVINTVRALGGIVEMHPPSAIQSGAGPLPYDPSSPATVGLPAVPMAHGGALGVIEDNPAVNENAFLTEDGGKWV